VTVLHGDDRPGGQGERFVAGPQGLRVPSFRERP